jgi:protein SCO1/2
MKKILFPAVIALTLIMGCNSTKESQTVYQCPMQCEGEKTYDKPGECPVCKMELKVPKANGH